MSAVPEGQARYGGAGLGQGDEYELRPPGDPLYNANDPKEAAIIGFRSERFESYGFSPSDALLMAIRRDVDRAQVESMVKRGATHAQVKDTVL